MHGEAEPTSAALDEAAEGRPGGDERGERGGAVEGRGLAVDAVSRAPCRWRDEEGL